MRKFSIAALVASSLALTACAATMDDGMDAMPAAASTTVVEAAMATPDLSTLVTAVQAAGLVDTLNSPGPFTVFAPTNQAFSAVPAPTLNSLLQPANRAQLSSVLTYHVVAGRVSSAELMRRIRAGGGSTSVTTLQGGTLRFSMMGDRVMIAGNNGSSGHVAMADLNQSNGVVHVIDGVLMP